MPWNQPGPGGDREPNRDRNPDPWGKRGGGNQGPPDLDEIVRNIQRRLGSLFGNRGGGGGGGAGRRGGQLPGKFGIGAIAAILALAWVASGFYIVQEGEEAVVLRFGKYASTQGAGLHWHLPYPIESKESVNVENVRTVEVGYRSNPRTQQASSVPREALMLTADENIIDINFAVQYNIKSAQDLLFKVADPLELVVRQATETAVREIVGRSTMDFVLTEGRGEVAQRTKALVQDILDRYQTGVRLVNVEMQNAQPPAEVQDAFDDAVRAREDEQRLKNEAQAYANDIIPRARGQAARMLEEAQAYKQAKIARAEGEASRFTQVLAEYEKAPDVTRERLYIETMENVLGSSGKLLVDQPEGGNSIFYLPLDQIMRRQAEAGNSSMMSVDQAGSAGSGSSSPRDLGSEFQRSRRSREDLRSRSQ